MLHWVSEFTMAFRSTYSSHVNRAWKEDGWCLWFICKLFKVNTQLLFTSQTLQVQGLKCYRYQWRRTRSPANCTFIEALGFTDKKIQGKKCLVTIEAVHQAVYSPLSTIPGMSQVSSWSKELSPSLPCGQQGPQHSSYYLLCSRLNVKRKLGSAARGRNRV